MVFKRRDKLPFPTRLRGLLFPRRGWRRGIEYLAHRMRRLPDTPHRISLGFSCGVFMSFTPFFGLHFILAAAMARAIRGNALAALIGTAAGNPLTFPVIASFALGLGRRILGFGASGRDFRRFAEGFRQFFVGVWESFLNLFGAGHADWHKLTLLLQDVIWPYFVGGLLPGLVAAIASYYLVRPLVAAYQAGRRARLLARAKARLLRRKPEAGIRAASTYTRRDREAAGSNGLK
jgi:uncharacterized protein (DUF2062 family)